MLTYQDFVAEPNRAVFIEHAIATYRDSREYKIAQDADLYAAQRNVTINRVVRLFDDADGPESQARIACNYFARLNRQRCAYLLGNGVHFTNTEKRLNREGMLIDYDLTKDLLGRDFDTQLMRWGWYALIHGTSYGFWNFRRLIVYPMTEFCPLPDEEDGRLRAGIRFWRLDANRPMIVELYEEDGVTRYRSGERGLVAVGEKHGYILDTVSTEAAGESVVATRNYGRLPVVPMYGNEQRQSTLVGMRARIDSIDLVASGFARDMQQATRIYWLIQNCGGMTLQERRDFLRQIREEHIASVNTDGAFDGSARDALSPYVQDVPYQGNAAYLEYARNALYEDFGAVDVHTIAAGDTNDHIDAAYQPMDEEADLFEAQVIEAVQGVLALLGVDDVPLFDRNRVKNVTEQVNAVLNAARYLDTQTIVKKLPFLTVDEQEAALQRLDAENAARIRLRTGAGDGDDDLGEPAR